MYGTPGSTINWYEHLLTLGTWELNPSFITSARSQDYDYRNTLGSYKNLRTAAVPAHETFNQDMTLMLNRGRVYTTTATVAINSSTDYVWGMVCLENLGGTISAAAVWSILDISAVPAN
jgi:hypothetical protein